MPETPNPPLRLSPKEEAAVREERARLLKEYKKTHDESTGARIRQLNWQLHQCSRTAFVKPPELHIDTVATARAERVVKRILIGFIVVVVVVVVVYALFRGPSFEEKAREEQEPLGKAIAIQAVKNHFGPGYNMLLLNPDTTTGYWFALPDHGAHECHRGSWGCFVVFYSVDVMPTGTTEKRHMQFRWFYDPLLSIPVPDNTEARTYFQPTE